ncbi:hypothetical protein V1477_004247 [Vespula maculifrons]|uniref:Uncharacterized protein n=1 Tax=Vespula maculifrons TaxID=7453 RepID=A0ABD2CR41_VESMC
MLHDRSCLDMSEADGVDGGAICKRGFIHLQFAEKPEAPEAERHLDTTGRVSRCLKPTVWTVEQSVSGVLYISSLLRSPKLPKRKGISSRFPVSPWVPKCSNLHAVGPGSLYFGIRREYTEIFADAIRANLNVKWGYTASRDDNNIGSLADLYSSWFSSALDIDE